MSTATRRRPAADAVQAASRHRDDANMLIAAVHRSPRSCRSSSSPAGADEQRGARRWPTSSWRSGLNIIVGFAGLLDLGYVAFFAIGAYMVGYFGSGFWDNAGGGEGIHVLVTEPASNLPGIHFNFLLILVLAVIATTIAGMLIGLPTLRLRGDYIAIVTLAFGEIIGRIAINGDEINDLRRHAHRRPPGHHAGRQDRPAVRRALQRAEPADPGTGSRSCSCCSCCS